MLLHCSFETNFNPSSNDKVPLATNAEKSPNECPATISGLKSSPKVLAKITECVKIPLVALLWFL
jgi:hypothetical protein